MAVNVGTLAIDSLVLFFTQLGANGTRFNQDTRTGNRYLIYVRTHYILTYTCLYSR